MKDTSTAKPAPIGDATAKSAEAKDEKAANPPSSLLCFWRGIWGHNGHAKE